MFNKKGVASGFLLKMIIVVLVLVVSFPLFGMIRDNTQSVGETVKCGGPTDAAQCQPSCHPDIQRPLGGSSVGNNFGCSFEDNAQTTASPETKPDFLSHVSDEEWSRTYYDESTWNVCCLNTG